MNSQILLFKTATDLLEIKRQPKRVKRYINYCKNTNLKKQLFNDYKKVITKNKINL